MRTATELQYFIVKFTAQLEKHDCSRPRKGRAIVPMNRPLKAALIEAKQGALSDYVIEWAGDPVASVKRGLKSSARQAGIVHISPHMLRHCPIPQRHYRPRTKRSALWFSEPKTVNGQRTWGTYCTEIDSLSTRNYTQFGAITLFTRERS